MKTAALAILVAALAAGSAEAQTATQALMAAPLRATPKGVALDIAPPQAAISPRYEGAPPARIPGVAKTAVDHRFDDPGVVGSLGFLCGLEAGAERQSGAAAARGYDPSGRFVGAKLRVAFR